MAQIILELIRFSQYNNGINDLIPIISGNVKKKYDNISGKYIEKYLDKKSSFIAADEIYKSL